MSKKGSFEVHHVASFDVYASANRSKLATLYPFLISKQIDSRLKEGWKCLDVEERKKYTKAVVKTTPEKHVTTRKYALKQEKQRKDTSTKSCQKKKKKEEKTEVKGTPKYANRRKLNNFRDSKAGIHFEFNSEGDSDKDWPVFKPDLNSQEVWSKSCQEKLLQEKMTVVMKETPKKQPGILKPRYIRAQQ